MSQMRVQTGMDPITKAPIFAYFHSGLIMRHVRRYKVPGPVKAGNHISKRGTVIRAFVWPGCEWRPDRPAMLAARKEKRRVQA